MGEFSLTAIILLWPSLQFAASLFLLKLILSHASTVSLGVGKRMPVPTCRSQLIAYLFKLCIDLVGHILQRWCCLSRYFLFVNNMNRK